MNEILEKAGISDKRWYTEHSRQLGDAVHSAVHYLEDQDLDLNSVCPEVAPYLGAYVLFKRTSHFNTISVERIVFSAKYMYAGRCDLVGFLNGHRVLIDVKTGQVPTWVNLQLCAYRQALHEMGTEIDKTFSLQLRRNGSYRLREHNDQRDLYVFLEARKKVA